MQLQVQIVVLGIFINLILVWPLQFKTVLPVILLALLAQALAQVVVRLVLKMQLFNQTKLVCVAKDG